MRPAQATVGLIGAGKIGQTTLKRLLAFGIKRALYTTSQLGKELPASRDYFKTLPLASFLGVEVRPAGSYDEIARECDLVILCCPLTPQTRHLVDAEFLAKMKPTACIVNTARGPVIDTDALVSAIREGRIASAGLDVVTGEPNIPADHPLVQEERIVLVPHIGSATIQARSGMSRDAARNCLAGVGVSGFEWANEVKL